MGRLLTLLAAKPAVRKFIIAGNRNRVPTGYALSGNANVMKYDGGWHLAPKDTGLSAVRAFFENRYAQANGPNAATGLVPFNLQAAVEYVVDGTVTTNLFPLKFSGADQRAVAAGDGAWSDWAAVNIPAGAAYRIRTDREHTGTGGTTYNQLNNILISSATTPGKRDHATSGTDTAVHKSRGDGGTYADFGGTTNTWTATCVQGVPIVPGTRSVLLVGDSITRGSGDTKASAPLQQGDWLAGTSPAAPYVNLGNVGWAETSLADAYPWFSTAVPGKQVVSSSFNEANLGAQLDVIKDSPPTHCVLALGVNDLMQGRTPAQVLADLASAVAVIKARWPSCKVYVCTITPVTNTTDAYATTANQTFTGTPPAGGTVTWGNFNGTDDTTGRRLLNANMRAGLVTGADGFIDVAAAVQDAADPRKWRVDLGQPTVDGVHPQAVLHRQTAAAANLPGVVAPAAASRVLWGTGDRATWDDGNLIIWS